MMLLPLGLSAQQQTPEEEEKQLRQAIEAQIEELSTILDLEYWQEFYLDSIMTHDYGAMRDELNELSKARMSNFDAYQRVQDKWNEKMYQAFSKVFTEDQWNKYLKAGAQRDKKNRDKREAKRMQ